jgi:hypothetical protein
MTRLSVDRIADMHIKTFLLHVARSMGKAKTEPKTKGTLWETIYVIRGIVNKELQEVLVVGEVAASFQALAGNRGWIRVWTRFL